MARIEKDKNISTNGNVISNYSATDGIQKDLNSLQKQIDALTGYEATYALVFDLAAANVNDGGFFVDGMGDGFNYMDASSLETNLEYVLQSNGFSGTIDIEEDNEVFTILVVLMHKLFALIYQ